MSINPGSGTPPLADDGVPRPKWLRGELRALNHTADELAVDALALEAGGIAQAELGEAVELAMGALAGLVEMRDGVTREQFAVAAGEAQAVPQALGGVVEVEAARAAGTEGAAWELEPAALTPAGGRSSPGSLTR